MGKNLILLMDAGHLPSLGFTPPRPPDIKGNATSLDQKLPLAQKKGFSTSAPEPSMKVVTASAPAKSSITLPKLQLPSFSKFSASAAEHDLGENFSVASSASSKNSQGSRAREMSFDPKGAPVATPRVEDVEKLVPHLNKVTLAPIETRQAAKRNARQERQSFIIGRRPQNLSPIPSSETASISSMSPLSMESKEEHEA